MSKFEVISVHFTNGCNLNCPICYIKKGGDIPKPHSFFIELVKYMKWFTRQIALGGGEPLLYPKFIKEFGKECKKEKLILNVTTNGKRIIDYTRNQLKLILKDVKMLSVSFDKYKWNYIEDYAKVIMKLQETMRIEIGSNLLLDKSMFDDNGKVLAKLVSYLFDIIGVNRIFLLYPKYHDLGIYLPKFKDLLASLSTIYPHLYTDDSVRQILYQGYKNWSDPCHYGNLVSINPTGHVFGCSFEKTPIMKLREPKDFLKIREMEISKRNDCPFIRSEYK